MKLGKREFGVAGSIVGMALGAFAVVGTPAWASSAATEQSAAAFCGVAGTIPYEEFSYVKASVQRIGCGDYVNFIGEIQEDLTLWPDPSVSYKSQWLYTGRLYLQQTCSYAGSGSFYSVARTSSGQYDESARRDVCY